MFKFKEKRIDHYLNQLGETSKRSFVYAICLIAFLSGGQSPEDATAHLNAIHTKFKNRLPWIVSFSFGRAIQQPALDKWKGKEANVEEAQTLLYFRSKCDLDANLGEYEAEMDNDIL